MILVIDDFGDVLKLDLDILPVWGGNLYGEHRTIICGKTQTEICVKLDISFYELKKWWAKTGNAKEVLMGNLFPGAVIVWAGNEWKVFPCVPSPKYLVE